ncbi:hypothetical protein QR680_002800 [Steinernema hermaphroditum]|uniref:Uncharacterized protein n=1 Tax=Steinernema hermaphroditum TaxID=289476 RepID=A0AA39H475_9BILA|nr:hypothetical protein QR680_002800 [Steinernema hermaphroditum]
MSKKRVEQLIILGTAIMSGDEPTLKKALLYCLDDVVAVRDSSFLLLLRSSDCHEARFKKLIKEAAILTKEILMLVNSRKLPVKHGNDLLEMQVKTLSVIFEDPRKMGDMPKGDINAEKLPRPEEGKQKNDETVPNESVEKSIKKISKFIGDCGGHPRKRHLHEATTNSSVKQPSPKRMRSLGPSKKQLETKPSMCKNVRIHKDSSTSLTVRDQSQAPSDAQVSKSQTIRRRARSAFPEERPAMPTIAKEKEPEERRDRSRSVHRTATQEVTSYSKRPLQEPLQNAPNARHVLKSVLPRSPEAPSNKSPPHVRAVAKVSTAKREDQSLKKETKFDSAKQRMVECIMAAKRAAAEKEKRRNFETASRGRCRSRARSVLRPAHSVE